ncbi:deoxynucleoside kinase [soil metagenome]
MADPVLTQSLRRRWRHIAVEGPIGVGKSSLARKLAAAFDAELLLELPQENPFLERFYADGSRYAFQTQMFFLFQRLDQYRALAQTQIFEAPVVADFMFEKDALFAKLTLDDEEYRLYQQMYAQLASRAARPDLVIWLRAEPQVLMQRIAQRGIAMERSIDLDYLQRLGDAYARHFESDTSTPVLAVDTQGFDPLSQQSHFDALLARLARFEGGRESYSPG